MGSLSLTVHGKTACTQCNVVIYNSVGGKTKSKSLCKIATTTDYPLWKWPLFDDDYTVTVTCANTPTCTASVPLKIRGNIVPKDIRLPCVAAVAPAPAPLMLKSAPAPKKAKAKTCGCTCCCGAKVAPKAGKKAAKRKAKPVAKKKAAVRKA